MRERVRERRERRTEFFFLHTYTHVMPFQGFFGGYTTFNLYPNTKNVSGN